jgi:hypothetical protein
MIAVESRARRGADDEIAVGSRFADRSVTFRVAKNIAPVHGHGAGPKTARARGADDGKLAGAEILHNPRHGADVAGATRMNQHYSNISQHFLDGLNELNVLNYLNRSAPAFKLFKKFKSFKGSRSN